MHVWNLALNSSTDNTGYFACKYSSVFCFGCHKSICMASFGRKPVLGKEWYPGHSLAVCYAYISNMYTYVKKACGYRLTLYGTSAIFTFLKN